MRQLILALVFSIGLLSAPAWAVQSYKIDPNHSSFGFSVKHMMISNVPGTFDKFDGQVVYDPKDLANSKIDIIIQTASINTRNAQRDEHLQSPDFFDTAKFPTITFVSKKITATDIVGDLTIKGVIKEVTIPTTITGPVKAMMGKDAIGINAAFTLNRQDYGVNWNKTLDQGGLAVSNDVAVTVSIEADQK
ncbi:MAG: YceI family protein [Candidatus Omnitrophica bacterium]|nr:YceI family protein [Candidatus Omnitrophota bacterium]